MHSWRCRIVVSVPACPVKHFVDKLSAKKTRDDLDILHIGIYAIFLLLSRFLDHSLLTRTDNK